MGSSEPAHQSCGHRYWASKVIENEPVLRGAGEEESTRQKEREEKGDSRACAGERAGLGKGGRAKTTSGWDEMMGETRSTRLKAANDDSVLFIQSWRPLVKDGTGAHVTGSSSYIAMKLSSAPCPFIPPHPLSFPSPQCLRKEAENATTTCPPIVPGTSREPSGPAVPPISKSVPTLLFPNLAHSSHHLTCFFSFYQFLHHTTHDHKRTHARTS